MGTLADVLAVGTIDEVWLNIVCLCDVDLCNGGLLAMLLGGVIEP